MIENILQRLEKTIEVEMSKYDKIDKHIMDEIAAEVARKFRISKKEIKRLMLKELRINLY